jgi:asparagine synthase (glutamine-hydrolysing)
VVAHEPERESLGKARSQSHNVDPEAVQELARPAVPAHPIAEHSCGRSAARPITKFGALLVSGEFRVGRSISGECWMCGICGVAAVDPSRRVDEDTLRKMADVIIYRGPDDSGMHVSGPVGLAMRRLSIIDLEGGKQPVPNEDGTVHLVFNGELYNYRELRSQLEPHGHDFRTDSDTEVVVHAYEEWGISCLDRFRGMFAFALWDDRRETLLLAVDRFGIKPLYYGLLGGDLVFGSELASLLASGRLAKAIDHAALAEYFTLGYVPPPATIFRGARKLEPGMFLQWTPQQGAVVERYWEIPAAQDEVTYAPAALRRELRELLRDAVRAHMVSDVPLGAFLSGGIDSSTVVALMSEVSEEPVRTFSIGFKDREHDERALARLVAKRFRTDHQELIVEPESVDVLPKLVSHFQEPFADSSALPTYYMSKLARDSVKVALSGDGGDELFVGYTTFRGVELARYAQSLPGVARRALAWLPGRLPRSGDARWNDRVARWQKWATDTALPPEAAYRSKITMAGLPVIAPLLTPELRHQLGAENPFRAVDVALAAMPAAPSLERILYAGLKVSLAGDMLVKVDRMSMANSLEVRVPLLDHVVAEFVAQIPLATRFPRWRLKALLKETMSDSLPAEVLRQPKHGFTVPLAAWFRGDLAQFAGDVLLSPKARDRGFFDTRAVERFLGDHARGRRNLGLPIWSLLIFELWCLQILD